MLLACDFFQSVFSELITCVASKGTVDNEHDAVFYSELIPTVYICVSLPHNILSSTTTILNQFKLLCSSPSLYSLPLHLRHLQLRPQMTVALHRILTISLVPPHLAVISWPVVRHVGRIAQRSAMVMVLVLHRMYRFSATSSSTGHMLTVTDLITELYASVSVAES